MGGVHDGHRNRMRNRIRKSGLSSLAEHEILEYLLFAFVPRKDTNEIAHALINEFGALSRVLSADEEHLRKVAGMTDNASLFLASLPDVFRVYVNGVDSDVDRVDMSSRAKARSYLGTVLYGKREEQVCVAGLDAHDKLIKCETLSSGGGNSVALDVRAVMDFALKTGACSIILAHNHPSGNVEPSQADYELTRELLFTLSGVGITVRDHFIFHGGLYYSFEENGLIDKIKNIQNGLKEGMLYYD